jgi:hypothetical protein
MEDINRDSDDGAGEEGIPGNSEPMQQDPRGHSSAITETLKLSLSDN